MITTAKPTEQKRELTRREQRQRALYFEKQALKNPNSPENEFRNMPKILTSTVKSGKTKAECLFHGNVAKITIGGKVLKS